MEFRRREGGVETREFRIRIRQWRRMRITTSYVLHPSAPLVIFLPPTTSSMWSPPRALNTCSTSTNLPRPYHPKALDVVPDALTQPSSADLAVSFQEHWTRSQHERFQKSDEKLRTITFVRILSSGIRCERVAIEKFCHVNFIFAQQQQF